MKKLTESFKGWIKSQLATKASRTLFGAWSLLMFLLGVWLG